MVVKGLLTKLLCNNRICRSILMHCIDFKGTAWRGRLVQAGTSYHIQFSCLSALTTDVFLLFLHHLPCTLLENKTKYSNPLY